MAGFTNASTSLGYALKKYYSKKKPEDAATRKRPFLSMIKKSDGWVGDGDFKLPLKYANPQSVSAAFSTAQGIAGTSKGVQWTITEAALYGVASVAGSLLLRTREDQYVKAAIEASDATLDEMGRRLAIQLYGTGAGAIGRRSSISSDTITLATADDAKNFQVGMQLQASGTLSGGSLRDTGDYFTVTNVDIDAGTVTVDDQSTISGFVDNDYLYPKGGYDTGLKGLAAWFPLTAPSSTSFFGIDRTIDIARLSGSRLDSTGNTIQENALTLATKIHNIGGSCDMMLLNPTNWTSLVKDMGAKVVRDEGGEAVGGFSAVRLETACGSVKVYSDPDCPTNRGYMLNSDTLFVKHIGGWPHLISDDNNTSLRVYNEDSVEWRFRAIGQFCCDSPRDNGVFSI
jgi:hypothetical protein